MCKPTTNRYSAQVRSRAVRMVSDHRAKHPSQWAAIHSIARKIGCMGETLRGWVRQAERDRGCGMVPPPSTASASVPWNARTASCAKPTRSCARRRHILLRRSLTARSSDDRVHRRLPHGLRGRADLPRAADCPHLWPAQGHAVRSASIPKITKFSLRRVGWSSIHRTTACNACCRSMSIGIHTVWEASAKTNSEATIPAQKPAPKVVVCSADTSARHEGITWVAGGQEAHAMPWAAIEMPSVAIRTPPRRNTLSPLSVVLSYQQPGQPTRVYQGRSN